MNKPSPDQISAAQALLEWYLAMGVDCAIGHESRDRRVDNRQAAPPNQDSAKTAAYNPGDHGVHVPRDVSRSRQQPSGPVPEERDRIGTATAPQEAEHLARRLASQAQDLIELEAALSAFDGCALKKTAKNLCFYRGSATAPLAIIGEAPGRDEDIAGKPFVGRAGQLLDKMLASIDLGDDDVHITNIVYWRPPGNRTPTPLEAEICRPFLLRQLQILAPKLILVLGGAAAKSMLEVNDGIMRLRGRWRTLPIDGKHVPVLASLHPAYLLRTPAAKRLAWRDLLAVQHALKSS